MRNLSVRGFRIGILALRIAGTLACSRVSLANTDIETEGVSDYSWANAHEIGAGNINGATCSEGFRSEMLVSGSGWTQGEHFTDSSVFDTDFLDHDASGDPDDVDFVNFDVPSNAIGFFAGHGTCDDTTTQVCSTTTDCLSGQSCPGTPPTVHTTLCVKNSPRRFVTSSPFSKHGDMIFYGEGNVKWGETAAVGAWGGGGTDGGLMVAFVDNSCAVRAPFIDSELKPIFAGLTQLDMIMPVSNVTVAGTADDWSWGGRGAAVATYAIANPGAAVIQAWDASLNGAPQNQGHSCPDLTTTYTYGGGQGIDGCGANLTVAYDSTASFAVWDVQALSWLAARNNANRSNGNGYFSTWAHCNYDCIKYPFTK